MEEVPIPRNLLHICHAAQTCAAVLRYASTLLKRPTDGDFDRRVGAVLTRKL
ncbi:hypothetical protein FHX08_005898 [Rhizobium sp. BK529]|nr:hypothetical protein [Rhizobium sp. BK529]